MSSSAPVLARAESPWQTLLRQQREAKLRRMRTDPLSFLEGFGEFDPRHLASCSTCAGGIVWDSRSGRPSICECVYVAAFNWCYTAYLHSDEQSFLGRRAFRYAEYRADFERLTCRHVASRGLRAAVLGFASDHGHQMETRRARAKLGRALVEAGLLPLLYFREPVLTTRWVLMCRQARHKSFRRSKV